MFNLTRQEQGVILFLVSLAVCGGGIDFFAKRSASVRALAFLNPEIYKIDINSAGKDLLMSVPGIGERIALRIIEYRQRHADFGSLEELKNIKGINEYRYGKIKDYLKVNR